MAKDQKTETPASTAIVKRDARGRLTPGTAKLPNAGRGKGIEAFVRNLVEEQLEDWDGRTLDGWEALTMMMYDVALGRKIPGEMQVDIKLKDRMDAIRFLFDRAHGKARIIVDAETHAPSALDALNIDDMDASELDALEAQVEAIAARMQGKAGAGAIIDMDADGQVAALDAAMVGDEEDEGGGEVK